MLNARCYVPGHWRRLRCLLPLLLVALSGCSLVGSLQEIKAISADRVPPQFLGRPRSELVKLPMSRLRQRPPQVYRLAPNDILGVYIETVVGDPKNLPPVHFPDDNSRPPSIGFPFPVREDGTIALPLVPPIPAEGLTLAQTSEAIRKAYVVDRRILPAGMDRIIVTLMRRRTYRVLVVREESGGQEGVTKRGTGHTVDLPAYENDLLHALNATGGMPGLDAANEILIFRDAFRGDAERGKLLAELNPGHAAHGQQQWSVDDSSAVRIPLRHYPGEVPQIEEQDIILGTGDIVVISARDREKFYTGGALPGGEHLLPRDYDLDVLAAIALAGGSVGNGGVGLSQVGNRSGDSRTGSAGVAPSRAVVLRKIPCGGQLPIRIDLNKALVDPAQRILVQPEDMIVVRYTLAEELYNAALNLVRFNFLFSGFNGGL